MYLFKERRNIILYILPPQHYQGENLANFPYIMVPFEKLKHYSNVLQKNVYLNDHIVLWDSITYSNVKAIRTNSAQ